MVFGGIAGILPPEHGETEEPGSLPSINVSRETGDLQDMYRRTLAASWTAQGDELLPDQLIEDLFAGGRGVRSATRSGARSERADDDEGSISDTGSRTTVQENRTDNKRPKSALSSRSRTDLRDTDSTMSSGGSGRGSLESSFQDTKAKAWKSSKASYEVSEFDVRDDLRTWEITVND